MFCRICGRNIPDDSCYCPYCGEKVILVEDNSIPKHIPKEENFALDNKIIPLKIFAQENGKMQLCKAASTNGELTRYLLFTKETIVQMSSKTADYSSLDIKERKDYLAVHKCDDGRLVLELYDVNVH